MAEDGQIVGSVKHGQNAVGEGITRRDLGDLYAPRKGNGRMPLGVFGGGDVASLVGDGLVLIRAAAAAHRPRTADEAEGGGGRPGDVADGATREGGVLQLAEQAVVHVEDVIVTPPLDLERLEAVEAGVLPEGADGIHLGS